MNDDPRIVHVASELSVPLGPEAENDGNREFILDVIAAVDYANEMVSGEAPAAPLGVGRWVAGADGVDRWHHTGSGSGEAPAAPGEVT